MLEKCKFIEFDYHTDNRGSLVIVENLLPFDIKRIYYLYDSTSSRGEHAHKELEQCIIAIKGSFDITIEDGSQVKTFQMNDPKKGLYICPMIWRRLTNFSSDCVCLVLASDYYCESEYIRDYEEFKNATR